ncbi:MAG TPA: sulfite oxidase [Saprospiraceae bacterium]|nr:sulfite oxidase [Saprospiraceae bacterium]
MKTSTRRGFIKKASLLTTGIMSGYTLLGSKTIPSGDTFMGFPEWYNKIPGKSDQLILLSDRPLNAETPVHLLGEKMTPNDLFFVRNNGLPPANPDPKTWTLEVKGESVIQPKIYTLNDLKTRFETTTLQLTIECAGNGRSEYQPSTTGLQWSAGAVGCASWTGVRLKDVLQDAGIKDDAVYVGYCGKDTHLSGNTSFFPISRGVPIHKAMEAESLIAWGMNGRDLPLLNGYPLRLVFGGYPASCSGKWLFRIVVRNKIHDGEKMGGKSYRTPCTPVVPGAHVDDRDMCIIENMPVKSVITYPKTGAIIRKNQKLTLKGQAWTSATRVNEVLLSKDYGISWNQCKLSTPLNRYAWQQWEGLLSFDAPGYYEIYVRATDTAGQSQSMLVPGWNPEGYLNNACHRISIKVTG